MQNANEKSVGRRLRARAADTLFSVSKSRKSFMTGTRPFLSLIRKRCVRAQGSQATTVSPSVQRVPVLAGKVNKFKTDNFRASYLSHTAIAYPLPPPSITNCCCPGKPNTRVVDPAGPHPPRNTGIIYVYVLGDQRPADHPVPSI
jgi:hypothetical protein